MPDKFDAYREALIVEETTVWPEEYDEFGEAEKSEIEKSLHADPENCGNLEYIRMHTGFIRQVTVTAEDLQRLGVEV